MPKKVEVGNWLAHKKEGAEQPLIVHLRQTAALAQSYGNKWGAGELAYLMGLLHDVGKYSEAFQRRLNGENLQVDHSTAGAQLAWQSCAGLGFIPAFCIAGHHGGLPDMIGSQEGRKSLKERLKKQVPDYQAYQGELHLPAMSALPKLQMPVSQGFSLYLLIKMMYSCLVDADYTDTASFMTGVEYQEANPALAMLNRQLTAYLQELDQTLQQNGLAEKKVNLERRKIRDCCLAAADGPQGLYTLTVPTGGGKTLSSLAFALQHGMKHGLDRVVYAIPYTSIIEQNAAVYQAIFGQEQVLEQHSEIDIQDIKYETLRLAAEKWDMPIIATTNVQFFESFFSNRPGRSRKLHRMAKSVIVLDEAQMLPFHLLLPCLALLVELVQNYHCTVVFCTATQPVLSDLLPQVLRQPKAALPVQEICPQVQAHHAAFRRNQIQLLGKLEKAEFCEMLSQQRASLTIVNTRKTALQLFQALQMEGKYYLTTLLCPVHRRKILAEIKERLRQGQPCTVVATSLIEAGVDVDFPVVYRELAGLDSIVQAAGRCNREGRAIGLGQVNVFEWAEREGKQQEEMLRKMELSKMVFEKFADVAAPEAMAYYFHQLYHFSSARSMDTGQILQEINLCDATHPDFPFEDIAQQFRVIVNDTKPIIIPYDEEAKGLIQALYHTESKGGFLRKLQRYMVNLHQREYAALLEQGQLSLLAEDIAILTDETIYDKDRLGLDIWQETGTATFV